MDDKREREERNLGPSDGGGGGYAEPVFFEFGPGFLRTSQMGPGRSFVAFTSAKQPAAASDTTVLDAKRSQNFPVWTRVVIKIKHSCLRHSGTSALRVGGGRTATFLLLHPELSEVVGGPNQITASDTELQQAGQLISLSWTTRLNVLRTPGNTEHHQICSIRLKYGLAAAGITDPVSLTQFWPSYCEQAKNLPDQSGALGKVAQLTDEIFNCEQSQIPTALRPLMAPRRVASDQPPT
ncbi:hypothetical protein DFH06DRAFT_1129787 [Mycena polygramma]|nr:hypothetical protein DFH06DRAFT_1129787 [Mycena polygramma]